MLRGVLSAKTPLLLILALTTIYTLYYFQRHPKPLPLALDDHDWSYYPAYDAEHWLNNPATESYLPQLSTSSLNLLSSIPPPTSRPSLQRLYTLRNASDWHRHLTSLSPLHTAPLTAFTQHILYTHQHPPTCPTRYLQMAAFPSDAAFGLGALIQAISSSLSLALRTNRILVYSPTLPPGHHFFTTGGLDNVFLPLTNCTPDPFIHDIVTLPLSETPKNPIYLRTHPESLPPLLGAAITAARPEWHAPEKKYWWRAQAAAFVARLNAPTMRRVGPGDGEGGWCVHVRHGDKGIEMPLIPFKAYVAAAEAYTLRNPLTMRRRGYLSSEDPRVLEEAAAMKGWEWRWERGVPRWDIGPEEQLKKVGNRTELTGWWVQQLVRGLECDGFVGTRGSAWNRLIDGLRCVWLESCGMPYLEVGERESWRNYG